MRIDVLTLFPELMQPYLSASILGRAQQACVVELRTHQLRDYSTDPHKKVDDRPFGGGPGMVLLCQPVIDAVNAIEKLDPRPALRLLLTPQGRVFNQDAAARYAGAERLLLICGHYEGFDERILELLQPEEVSIGDFVLTGGEIAALAIVDSVVRLLPGALGHEEAADLESFQNNLLDYPQYTRPRDFGGLSVPEILLSGNHAQVDAWRRAQAEQRTRQKRPDLLERRSGTGFQPVSKHCGTGFEQIRPVENRSQSLKPVDRNFIDFRACPLVQAEPGAIAKVGSAGRTVQRMN